MQAKYLFMVSVDVEPSREDAFNEVLRHRARPAPYNGGGEGINPSIQADIQLGQATQLTRLSATHM